MPQISLDTANSSMRIANPLTPFLEQGALILDGGLATELENRGADLSGGLWSARCILEAPDLLSRVHSEYLRAGADCLIAATYQASFLGFEAKGIAREEASLLILAAVSLAVEQRNEFWNHVENRLGRLRPLVAASVGPYGAFLADGSEYTGAYEVSTQRLRVFHEQRLALLTSSAADLLACETIPSSREAQVLADLLHEYPTPSWLSFCCRDGARLADGSRLGDVISSLSDHPSILAFGINCIPPRLVPELLRHARGATDKPLVAYANSGEIYDVTNGTWQESTESPEEFAVQAINWLHEGAQIIGGCCRTGPRDIREIRRRLIIPEGAR